MTNYLRRDQVKLLILAEAAKRDLKIEYEWDYEFQKMLFVIRVIDDQVVPMQISDLMRLKTKPNDMRYMIENWFMQLDRELK